MLNRDIIPDERIVGIKINKETYKLRAFADYLVLALDSLMGN